MTPLVTSMVFFSEIIFLLSLCPIPCMKTKMKVVMTDNKNGERHKLFCNAWKQGGHRDGRELVDFTIPVGLHVSKK